MRAGLVLMEVAVMSTAICACVFDPAGTRPEEDSGGATSTSVSSGTQASSSGQTASSSSGTGGSGGGAVCGNGSLEAPETCEDANLADGDGCDASCAFESNCDGVAVEIGELCDGGAACTSCTPNAGSICANAATLPIGISSHVTTASDPALSLGEAGMCGAPNDAKRKLLRHVMESPGRLVVYGEPESADGLIDPVAWLYPGCFGQPLGCSDAYASDTGKLLALTPRLPAGTPVTLSVSSHGAAELGGIKLYAMPALHEQHDFTDATLGAGWSLFMNQLFINRSDSTLSSASTKPIVCGGESALRIWVKHQFVQLATAMATLRAKIGAFEQTFTFAASPNATSWVRFDLPSDCPPGQNLEFDFRYQGASGEAWRIDALLVVSPRSENDAAPPF